MGERGAIMAAEISEQPQSLERLLRDGRDQFTAARTLIDRAQPRFALLAARGTSDHAALYAKYLIETRLGLPAGLVSASTLTVYNTAPQYDGVLW
ncbi:MAG: hypothetical protein VW239_04815, partial [Candidatus Nanopelagicales bacterium]